ncbi:MAG: hypothetical protein K9H13_02655 [Bacteroidales bacterium]|nr:hypothetical protein [Bacteroidales bacterium]MCF8343513.1 hypothetical protein [Bacteroidales bacterium]
MKVREHKKVADYLKSRQIVKPYLKAKHYIEEGLYEVVDLRKREPKNKTSFIFGLQKNTGRLVISMINMN